MANPSHAPPDSVPFGEAADPATRKGWADARLAEGKALEKEMQNGLRSGRLIRREQAMAVIAKLGGGVRTAMLRLPDELSENFEPEVAAAIRERVDTYLAQRLRPLFESAINSVNIIQDPHASKNNTKPAKADGGTSGILRD